ncbi:SOS response-associated peptidase [Candidatus Methylacidiphilum infernorum]|uniref:Abasic site processing protein n=2 Tax=Candidatus Methylacidiphilum infernorum TaxID=511746 RepID=A0ABX7PY73_9BACT|nr:SOS response-associated peptidase [Candidatus Methylacidiphilum infernorum]
MFFSPWLAKLKRPRMCGRFSLHTSPRVIQQVFKLDSLPDITPRYNIAPSTPILAIRKKEGKNDAALLRWGLVPHWAKEQKSGYSLINARAETLCSKPAFRESFKKRRCLIPADGFYEWQSVDGKKTPWYITLPDLPLFAFAGLWDSWRSPEQSVESCTIIVTEACEKLRPIHPRMPAILAPADYERWLQPTAGEEEKDLCLLKPWPGEIRLRRVSPAVNKPTVEGEGLIREV